MHNILLAILKQMIHINSDKLLHDKPSDDRSALYPLHPFRLLMVSSIRKFYGINFSVFPVDARCGDVNSHRGAPSRGLEWAGFEAASATDPAGRRTVHFPTTLPFSKPTLRTTPSYVISDISRWRECYASGVGCYWTFSSRRWYSDQFRCKNTRISFRYDEMRTKNVKLWKLKCQNDITSCHLPYLEVTFIFFHRSWFFWITWTYEMALKPIPV